MPLFLATNNQIHGAAAKVLLMPEYGLCLSPHDQYSQVRESKNLVKAKHGEIWRKFGVSKKQRRGWAK
jgi:hypothetical protein